MNKFSILKTAKKVVDTIAKPVNLFFGSDEKGWFTLTAACIGLYFTGFPDAAIIMAVYSTMFAFSGMQKYGSGGSEDTGQDLEEMQDMMDDALGMAEEFQEQADNEVEN